MAERPLLLAIGIVALSAAAAPALPLVDAYVLRGLATRSRGYGPIRGWGSVAFIVGNLGAGALLSAMPATHLIWPMAAAYWLGCLSATGLPKVDRPDAPARAAAPVRELLRIPGLMPVLAASALIQASHAVFYGFSTLQWRAAGLGGIEIGLLWAIGVVAEIVLFAVSGRLDAHIGSRGWLLLAAAGGALRWSAMAAQPAGALLPALQLLHAFSFAAAHLGAVQFVARAVPAGSAASAQGLLSFCNGLTMAAAMGTAGFLAARSEAAAYGLMALMAALGGVMIVATKLGATSARR